jgi:GAF domain-containing protein
VENQLNALYDLGQRLVLLRDPTQIAQAVLEIAAQVLDLQDSDFLLVDETLNELYVAARQGQLRCAEGLRLQLNGDKGITVAAIREGQPLYVPDVRQDPRYVDIGFPAVSEFAVPVQIEGRVLGVLNVESAKMDAFGEEDRELLCILANQASLALENARLHTQERRKIEELAILNQLNRRISASLDLEDTLDEIVHSAAELIPCALAEVSLWDEGTGLLTLQALHSDPDRRYPIGRCFPPGEGYTGWMVRRKQPLFVPDVDNFTEIRPQLLPGELPFKAYAGVPLLAGDDLVGTLVLVANQAGAFDSEDMRLLKSMANQAAVAIRNAQLFRAVKRQKAEQSALNAVASVINQPLLLQEILDLSTSKTIEVMGTDAGGIRLLDPKTNELEIVSSQGLSPEYIQVVDRIKIGEGVVGRVAQSGEPLVIKDLANDSISDIAQVVASEGYHTFAVVPIMAKEKVIGTLGVITRQPREFTGEDLDLMTAIGNQIGVAVENARLHQKALSAERMAAVGRVATSVAHDLRSPLGGIMRSAEFLARPELSPGTREKLSRAIVSLAQRLNNTTQQILDYVRKERLPLRCAPCSLAKFLGDVLTVLEVDFSDRGIEVVRDFRYRGKLIMDSDRMAQVVYNIAANARDAMPQGGKFGVSTRKVKDRVEMRFSDTGVGVPKEVGERIFEPFFSYGKRQGAGLGLSIAQRIVEEHGGTIRLESNEGEGAQFVVVLPL